ncbi:MAG TPA: hypothetical protein VJT81_00435 [Burkholderiales bacterium]|nr:hypothetical protein [Burkholderiales bacterium]
MTKKEAELAALSDEFNRSETLSLPEYTRRYTEIVNRADEPEPATHQTKKAILGERKGLTSAEYEQWAASLMRGELVEPLNRPEPTPAAAMITTKSADVPANLIISRPFSEDKFYENFKTYFEEVCDAMDAATGEDKEDLASLRNPASISAQLMAVTKAVRIELEKTYLHNAEKIQVLEAKVAELESRPVLKYAGVYSADAEYQRGEFVTHCGSLWHCWTKTREVPGTSDSWQLAVKRGAPGKDAR